MESRKRTLKISLLLVVLLVASFASGRVALANDAWVIVSSPNDGIGDNFLYAVSAGSSSCAVTVGSKSISGGGYNPTIQRWDGTSWSVVSSANVQPTSELNGVTNVPGQSSEFWAVGYQNASSRTLSGSGLYYDIGGAQTLIEHSTDCGQTWATVTSPSPGTSTNVLRGVAARTASDVWAVGNQMNTGGYIQTLILHYNGMQWSIVSSPNVQGVNNLLFGVSALASDDAWAVGLVDTQTLIVHWHAAVWDRVPSPSPSGVENWLFGVSDLSLTNAWAVGAAYNPNTRQKITVTEQWDGTQWNVVNSPNAAGSNFLGAISPISANYIWAVGGYEVPPYQTLIEKWDGTQWSIVPSPNQGTGPNELVGVSVVPGTSSCAGGDIWSAGNYVGTVHQTLIERYTITPGCRP
jgi:hypothetical protein